MIVVSNAGPLISLAQIGHFDVLKSLYGRLYLPQAVWREVTASGLGRPGAELVRTAEWIEIVQIRDVIAAQILRERLDAGESKALVLAIELTADLLLIDEARGRRVAEARGMHKSGTIGTLIAAKKRGLIAEIVPFSPLLPTAHRRGENRGSSGHFTLGLDHHRA